MDKNKMPVEEYVIKLLTAKMGEETVIDGISVIDMDCNKAQASLFLLMNRLEKEGLKLKLPWYWYTHGPRIQLNELIKMYPGVDWICTEKEFNQCPYQNDCDFEGKYRG